MNLKKSEKGAWFWELYSGSHDHQVTRVWVHPALVPSPDELGRVRIFFPFQGAEIQRTEKGSLVMKPDPNSIVYLVQVESGYRGSASIDQVAGGEIMASGREYKSPQGALGETAWALVNAQGPIHVRAWRSGRRVAKNELEFTILPDGREITDEEAEVAELFSK